MKMKCPKCGYVRQLGDEAMTPPSTCPSCGVVYAKFTLAQAGVVASKPENHGATEQKDPAPAPARPGQPIKMVLVGIDIPFGQLVELIFKASLAAIPAMILLAGVGAMLFFFLGILGAVFGHR